MKNVQTLSVLFAAVVLSLSVKAEPKLVNPVVAGTGLANSVYETDETIQVVTKEYAKDAKEKDASVELAILYKASMASEVQKKINNSSETAYFNNNNASSIREDVSNSISSQKLQKVQKSNLRDSGIALLMHNKAERNVWAVDNLTHTALHGYDSYILSYVQNTSHSLPIEYFKNIYGNPSYTFSLGYGLCSNNVAAHKMAKKHFNEITPNQVAHPNIVLAEQQLPSGYGSANVLIYADKDINGKLVQVKVSVCDGMIESVSEPEYVQEATKIATAKDTKNAKKSK